MENEEIKKMVEVLGAALFVLVNSKNEKVGDVDVMEAVEAVGLIRDVLHFLAKGDHYSFAGETLRQAKNLIRNNNVLKKFEGAFDCPKFDGD